MVLRHVKRPLLTSRVAFSGSDTLCGGVARGESISSCLILGGLLGLLLLLDGSVEFFRVLLSLLVGGQLIRIDGVQVALLISNLLLILSVQGVGMCLLRDGLSFDVTSLLCLKGGNLISPLGLISFDFAGDMNVVLPRQSCHVNHVLLLRSQMDALSGNGRLLGERDLRGFRGSLFGGLLIHFECVNGGTKQDDDGK